MKVLSSIVFFGLSTLARAQKSDLGNWLIYSDNKQINATWMFNCEIQYSTDATLMRNTRLVPSYTEVFINNRGALFDRNSD